MDNKTFPFKAIMRGHLSDPAKRTDLRLIISPETALNIIRLLSSSLEDPLPNGMVLKLVGSKITVCPEPGCKNQVHDHEAGELHIEIDKSNWDKRIGRYQFSPPNGV